MRDPGRTRPDRRTARPRANRPAGTRWDCLPLAREGLIMARRRSTSTVTTTRAPSAPRGNAGEDPDALHSQSLAQLPEACVAGLGLLAQRSPCGPDRAPTPGKRCPTCSRRPDRGHSCCGRTTTKTTRRNETNASRSGAFPTEFLGWKPDFLELYRPVAGARMFAGQEAPHAGQRPEPPTELQHELGHYSDVLQPTFAYRWP